MPIFPRSSTQRLVLWGVAWVGVISACIPWFRNYDYLRDFMDYGLVMSGVGRISAGEHPYIDFVTPIQAGFLYINLIFEKWGGGNYLAMTSGVPVLIVISGIGLTLMLRRWLPWWAAIPVIWSIVVCTATQHTIIWYNALGTLCLAGALWSVAAAPYFRRADWAWHGVLACCLIVGGLTKISYQFVAVAGVLGFLVRAALLPEGSMKKLGPMLVFTLGLGVVAPVVIELALTGATLSQWSYNVLELASGARAKYLLAAGSLKFYLVPKHDYYGPLSVPQIGGLIVALMMLVLLWGIRSVKALDRILFVIATVGCLMVGLSFLATNHEIAYISFGSALVLAVALGMAFRLPPHPTVVGLGLVAPSLVLGLAAWSSAWQGQRSQFGHSGSARADYRKITDTNPEFSYIRGLHIPPEIAESYETVAEWMPKASEDGTYPVMFTHGVEWLDRVWPPLRYPGLPLWSEGTSSGSIEIQLTQQAISPPSRLRRIFASIPWDQWPASLDSTVKLLMESQYCGPVLRVYTPAGYNDSRSDPLDVMTMLNLNFMPSLLELDEKTLIFPYDEFRKVLGSTEGASHFSFKGIVNTMRAEMIIRRRTADLSRAVSATFRVTRTYGDYETTEWEDVLELPAGQQEISRVINFDGQQQLLRFYVTQATETNDEILAGWFAPEMQHAKPNDEDPPSMFNDPKPLVEVTSEMRSALVKTEWQPDQVILRGGRVTSEGFELPPGGQVWLRADLALSTFDGVVRQAAGSTGPPATFRVFWYQGGRVQVTSYLRVSPSSQGHGFHSWSAADRGWFGIVVDPGPSNVPVVVEVNRAERAK